MAVALFEKFTEMYFVSYCYSFILKPKLKANFIYSLGKSVEHQIVSMTLSQTVEDSDLQ